MFRGHINVSKACTETTVHPRTEKFIHECMMHEPQKHLESTDLVHGAIIRQILEKHSHLRHFVEGRARIEEHLRVCAR